MGSTALGLVLIISGINHYNHTLFLLGNLFILVSGMCVWRESRMQGITAWREKIMKYGGVVGFVWLVVMLMWGWSVWTLTELPVWIQNQDGGGYWISSMAGDGAVWERWRMFLISDVVGLIIYLTSI